MKLAEMLDSWRNLASEGLAKGEKVVAEYKREFSRVIVAGMGGSGIIGDALVDLSYAYGFDLEIYPSKEPWIPGKLDQSVLLIALSYSGNTLETLAITQEAISKGAEVIVITSDGRLAQLASERGIPLVEITRELLPRAAFPEMFYATIKILETMGLTGFLSDVLIKRSIRVLEKREEASRQAKAISEEIGDSVPVFVATRPYVSIAERFKKDLAENSKRYSCVEVLPEAGHNSIEALYSLANGQNYKIVYIIGGDNTYSVFSKAFAETLKGKSNQFTIDFTGVGNVLEEILWGFWVSGYTSLNLARSRGMTPEETPVLSMYRSKLKEFFK